MGLLGTGCSGSTSDRSVMYTEVAKAMPLHRKAVMEAKDPSAVVFVDPRPVAQFEAGRIAGAAHLTLVQANAGTLRIDPSLAPRHADKTRPTSLSEYDAIVVYGNDPASGVALAMAKRLLHLGFDEVYVLRGGLRAWRTQGGPVDEPAPAASPTPQSPPTPTP